LKFDAEVVYQQTASAALHRLIPGDWFRECDCLRESGEITIPCTFASSPELVRLGRFFSPGKVGVSMSRLLCTTVVFLGLAAVSFEAATLSAADPKPIPTRQTAIKPSRVQSMASPHVAEHLDVVYARYDKREMHLDLFVPKQGNGPLPTIVVVHGGGWLNGNKTKFRPLAQALAARGFVTAAVEYRLGGEAKFPAGIQDCNTAVRWLRTAGQKYRVDPKRIAAVGGSAGGHLAGLMAAAPHVTAFQGDGGNTSASSALQAAVVLAGPLELATGAVAERSRKEPKKSNANQWFGKTVDEAPDLYRQASPFTHISKTSPPMLFMTGEFDHPERNRATRDKLRGFGIPTDILVYKQGKHGCWNQHPWFHPMVEDIDRFLATVLKKSESTRDSNPIRTGWGEIHRLATRVELHVQKLPASGMLTIPRLNVPIGDVYLQGDAEKSPIKVRPGVKDWQFTLPKTAKVGAVVVIETKATPYLPQLPRIVSQAKDNSVTLPAHHAVTHGRMLRYEPQPHKNTVGYWVDAKDFCEWHFHVDQPGRFDVQILQGCGKGHGGSEVAVVVGEQQMKFTVEDTGHFQNFKRRTIGTLTVTKPGRHTLRIQPVRKAKAAVMDVREIRLVPAKK
jgi:acetyl esterase/lipase